MKDHVALYGNTALPRAWCGACDQFAFVLHGVRQCCNAPYAGASGLPLRRMASPAVYRRKPSVKRQTELLKAQEFKCFYCDQMFGFKVRYKGKMVRLHYVWDHVLPWIHTQNNRPENFVAACQKCNAMKSDKVFESAAIARAYLQAKWEERQK